ncbi:hypothetical protein QI155_09895 [Thermodesulfovibrio sp. 1176]|uniref:hypothetical protein n=1 Tax=Thermodesulfovibrio sp. 1176 TaxID=3043424 RepID=UPI002482B344|nr:hypothetical protein [Thermodesulfovibrio sp. 1176]MDI1472843.1 hypothetical protein [Thermodesulfovibrio sp. 1176]
MLRKVVVFLTLLFFMSSSAVYAIDPGCIAGGCEQSSQEQSASSLYETDDYDCVCPPRDTLKTIINIFGVLTLPFQFFSAKPNFNTGGTSLAELIQDGCKCKPKVKSYSQEQQDNAKELKEPEQQVNASNPAGESNETK